MENLTDNITKKIWDDLISWQESFFIPVSIILSVVGTIAVSFNAAVLLTIKRQQHDMSMPLVMTYSLVTADMLTGLVVLLINLYPYVIWGKATGVPDCATIVMEILISSCFITSILQFFVLSIIHFVGVVKPFLYQSRWAHSTRAKYVLIGIWLGPLAMWIALLSLIPNEGFLTNGGKCDNFDSLFGLEFRLFILVLLGLIWIASGALYIKISCTLNNSAAMNEHLAQPLKQRRERKVILTTLILWLSFTVSLIPDLVIGTLSCDICPFSRYDLTTAKLGLILRSLGELFLMIRTIVNPVVCALRFKEIHLALKCTWQRRQHNHADESFRVTFKENDLQESGYPTVEILHF